MSMTTPKIPFERAVRIHGPAVLRVCRAALGYGPDADDAYSETFLAALRSWPDLPGNTNTEAWLVRVAQRKTIDIVRARARRAVPTNAVPEMHSSIGNPGDTDDGLWKSVADLPERQRLAIAYHYLGGLAHTETAELIGSNAAAVRRAASDGIKALRQNYLSAAAREGT